MASTQVRNTNQKIQLFRRLFTGLPNVYGTYDLRTGRVRQVKEPVNDRVIYLHLAGQQPYGVYLLVKDRIRALAVDFDQPEIELPIEFIAAARHYGLPAYLERSKSKGYHVWIFFEEAGVSARKARLVVHHILSEIGITHTEIFPKQDTLDGQATYGNFINAPLFGGLVPQGRTVFVDLGDPTKPLTNQWDFLESIQRVREADLDTIIEINDLNCNTCPAQEPVEQKNNWERIPLGLPPCVQRILVEGVCDFQRVACFRLAVHFKRIGLPLDLAVAVLRTWARKNKPPPEKTIITEAEIQAQTESAYAKDYRGYGCEDPAIAAFCNPRCSLYQKRQEHLGDNVRTDRATKPAVSNPTTRRGS